MIKFAGDLQIAEIVWRFCVTIALVTKMKPGRKKAIGKTGNGNNKKVN